MVGWCEVGWCLRMVETIEKEEHNQEVQTLTKGQLEASGAKLGNNLLTLKKEWAKERNELMQIIADNSCNDTAMEIHRYDRQA